MAMRRASPPRVITSHEDPEHGGGKNDEAPEALAARDHGKEQHYAEHDRDRGVGAVERPEPSHQKARTRSNQSSRALSTSAHEDAIRRNAIPPRAVAQGPCYSGCHARREVKAGGSSAFYAPVGGSGLSRPWGRAAIAGRSAVGSAGVEAVAYAGCGGDRPPDALGRPAGVPVEGVVGAG